MGLTALKSEDLPQYTYDDYAQWEGRWEIINGVPYAMTPSPNVKHQTLSHKIDGQLYNLLKKCKYCRALLPVDWKIDENTVVQPDNLVICGENRNNEFLTIAPVLVFEILSPSTRNKDRALKYRLYQAAGVKYYCIVNPDTNSVEVFELQGCQYKERSDFQAEKIIFDLGPCSIVFDFKEIFSA